MILLDTNLLARITDPKHPHCAVSRSAVHRLLARGERLVIVPQDLYELWAVATRKSGPPPAGQNGLGMTCGQTTQWLNYFQRRFALLNDRADLLPTWHNLVNTLAIKGLKSHDARLVAAMHTYGISRLLTFNSNDFKGFSISVIDPASV